MTDATNAMTTAEEIISTLLKAEPILAGILGAVIPGAAPIIAIVQPEISILAPFITNALHTLHASNGGNAIDAIVSLIQHLTPGHPNAAPLAPPPAS